MLDLRRLEYFATVAEELHYGRAAARLGIAQPPLSQAVIKLEQELGVLLLQRTRRSVTLTREGELLLAQARPLLADARRLEASARRLAAGAGFLRLGFVGSACHRLLPALLARLGARAPDLELELRQLQTERQLALLRERRLDVGIVRAAEASEDIRLDVLGTEELVAALPARHPLARRERVPLAALADEPFVLIARGANEALHDDVLTACRSAGFTPQAAQEADELQTQAALVAGRLGVALVPSTSTTIRRSEVVYRPLADATPVAALALARRADDASPAVARVAAAAIRISAR